MNIMTKRGSLDNVVTYEHICDTYSDLATIKPEYTTLGSVAIVIEDETANNALGAYIANSNKEWIPLFTGSGSNELGLSAHICASGEYNTTTGVPTIENPDSSTFYFTPTGDNEPNLYNEWVYVDGKWEQFGDGILNAAVTADWEQETSSAATYIQNRPTIYAGNGNHSIVANSNTKSNATSESAFAANIGTASGQYSFAEGHGTANGNYSHAEGYGVASGNDSHAEGSYTTASGVGAHAEGGMTNASGYRSHAEGDNSDATTDFAHAEGNHTTASGAAAHSEGNTTTASGGAAHAEGYYTTASGIYSHAEGEYTTAVGRAQHVFGRYNILDTIPEAWSAANTYNAGDQIMALNVRYVCLTDSLVSSTEPRNDSTNWKVMPSNCNYVEIVGNGTGPSAKSNARVLDWEGNETLAGNLTINGTSLTIGNTTITEAQLQNLLSLGN